ncbi:hypothetical protein EGT49_07770 [Companilactobacillus suantsaicola]|uniref:WxL domain-containing protein n=1 Tax=Companilactobacillus suantsaicola TaxID=2487723 RepID=A0A4Z0JIV6_9LACO|nr:WxL domain-containing protein [Companilactobacillus suantsaicola]TGD22814.1 hypothetical protein EGT49_07770 [Companilactobacillus suantsaicola]
MKLSKSVLAGSLATAGIVLGAIAPAVTAQAATGTGDQAADGSVTYNKDGVDVGKLGSGKLAIAYAGDAEGQEGKATAESNANVTVQSGLLTLDAVPDFGFANAAEGTTVALDNNDTNGNPATDSQGKGVLTVTESRAKEPGFTLGASITKFANVDDSTDTKAYTLNLKPTELKNDKGESIATGATALNTKDMSITGGATGTADNLIDLEGGTYNAGPINASFTADDKNAFLDLTDPSSTGSDKNGVKSYNATITWTLTSQPVVAAG